MRNDETSAFYFGTLAPFMAEYMQYNRSQGKKYEYVPYILASFSKAVMRRNISIEKVDQIFLSEWAAENGVNSVARNHKLYIIKQFLVFMQHKGFSVYIPAKIKFIKSGFVPYIFTKNEINAFFYACDSFTAKTKFVNLSIVIPVLFRILYCCGLRISEAVKLKINDLDLDYGYIKIREGKFNKERLTPIQPCLTKYCISYLRKNHFVYTGDEYLFQKRNGFHYSSDYMHRTFKKLLWKAGISYGGKGVGPRLHDFRHSFAVHSLKKMHDEGMDIYCALPLLSTYLGHASIAATEKYVRLTQDIFPEVVAEISNLSSFVIPEVKINEKDD